MKDQHLALCAMPLRTAKVVVVMVSCVEVQRREGGTMTSSCLAGHMQYGRRSSVHTDRAAKKEVNTDTPTRTAYRSTAELGAAQPSTSGVVSEYRLGDEQKGGSRTSSRYGDGCWE